MRNGSYTSVRVSISSESATDNVSMPTGPRGGSDQSKLWNRQINRLGARAFPDNNVELEVFHHGIKRFFHRMIEPVDFIDKKNVPFRQAGQNRRQISLAFEHRAGGDPQ